MNELLWCSFFISSSESVAVIEVLFEALDPTDTINDVGNVRSKMGAATSQPADAHPDVDSVHHQTGTPGGLTCNRPGEGSNDGSSCGAGYRHTNDTVLRDGIIAHSADGVDSDSDLRFHLDGNCGCAVQHPSCAAGANTGNCKFKEGTETARLRERRARLEAMAENTDTDCDHWPQCAGVQSKVIGVLGSESAAKSGEVERRCVLSKKCKVDAVKERNNAFPFGCFSRKDDAEGNAVYWKKGEDCPSALKFQEILDEPAVHRRRAPWSAEVQRRLARRLMGVDQIFVGEDEETFWKNAANPDAAKAGGAEDPLHEFQVAVRGFEAMVAAGNKSYAYYQVQAIRSDLESLYEFYNANKQTVMAAARNLTISTRVAQTVEYTQAVLGHSRRLLFGFSGVEAEKIGCGWLAVDDFMPNTYPVRARPP